jgi:hypothetical protein
VPKLDSLLMRAHLLRVEAERPELDHAIVRGLYERFMDCRERQPDLHEFRDYVDEIASSFDWLDLWHQFSPHEPTVEEHEGMCAPVEPAPRRSRGRPKGTRSASSEAIVAGFRTFRATHRRRPTQVQLASNLKPPIAARTLQDLLGEYGLPWPIE